MNVRKVLFLFCLIIAFFIFKLDVMAYDRTIDDGVYVIHSSINDNYVLDANGAIANNGTNIQLYQSNGGLSQKWIVKYQKDGYYQITSTINDNYALDVNGAIFNNSVNIQLWDKSNSIAQKWYIKDDGDGYCKLISYNQNYSLDANGAIAANFTNIQLWNSSNSLAQKFRFEKIYNIGKTIENGVYTISTAMDENKVFDLYGGYIKDNTNLQLYNSHGGDGQKFYVTYLGDGFYSIKSYLNINYGLSANKNNVELYKYSGGSLQKWIINDTGNGYYNIISKFNYLSVDVHGGYTTNETNIELYGFHNTNNQKFKFNKEETKGTKSIQNGYYFISSGLNSKKVLDINNGVMEDKRNVEIYSLNYGINQKWYIEYLNNGYYKILANKNNDYALQVDGFNTNIGIYSGLDSQQWAIKKNSNGYYIVSKMGNYLDLYYGNIANTTNIQVYPFNGGNGQIFYKDC